MTCRNDSEGEVGQLIDVCASQLSSHLRLGEICLQLQHPLVSEHQQTHQTRTLLRDPASTDSQNTSLDKNIPTHSPSSSTSAEYQTCPSHAAADP